MVRHALSHGCVVPIEVMERLDQAISGADEPVAAAILPERADIAPADAASRSAIVAKTSRFLLLAEAHAGLANAIAPATPEAVRLMADERERHPLRCEFGPVPLVRQLLGLALISLVILLGPALPRK